ncbi:MAG TPA: type II secretion system F family protein [Anaerolineae bacterium]
MDLLLPVSVGFGLAVAFIFAAFAIILRRQSISLEKRLDPQAAQWSAGFSQTEQARPGGFTARRIVPADMRARVAAELARADLKLTVFEYVLANIGAVFVGGLLGYVIFRGNLVTALAGAVLGAFAPRMYVRFLQGRRLANFENQLNDMLMLLSNSLRSGYGLTQSVENIARELAPPTSLEFARVTREVALGLSAQDALRNLYRRMPSDDLDLIITTITVQQEVGGNLAEILDTIAFTIRERVRIKRELRVMTAQQRFTGYVLGFMPVALAAVIFALSPGYMSVLWQETCGWEMVIAGLFWMLIGFLIIRRILALRV